MLGTKKVFQVASGKAQQCPDKLSDSGPLQLVLSACLFLQMEKPLRTYNLDRKRKHQGAADTCHVLTHWTNRAATFWTGLTSPTCARGTQDCAPVNWNTQWMVAAVASPLPPLVLTMFDLDLSRTALNLIQTGHYLSLPWICCRLGSIYCNLKPGKIQKTPQNVLFMWDAESVFLSGSQSVTDPTHSGKYKCLLVCLFPSSPKAGI